MKRIRGNVGKGSIEERDEEDKRESWEEYYRGSKFTAHRSCCQHFIIKTLLSTVKL